MKRILLFLLLLLPLCAQAQTYPVGLGAEWDNSAGFEFAASCDSRTLNGLACVQFPNGANIVGIAFQTSKKSPNGLGGGELLWGLLMSPTRSFNDPNRRNLIVTHQNAGVVADIHRDLMFAKPIQVPAGWYVWVHGAGWLESVSSAEMQTMLYLDRATSFVQIFGQ